MSNTNSYFTKVQEIVVDQLGVSAEDVGLNTKFIDDLGADSLDTAELMMAVEEYFGVGIPDELAESLTTAAEVVKFLEGKPKCVKCGSIVITTEFVPADKVIKSSALESVPLRDAFLSSSEYDYFFQIRAKIDHLHHTCGCCQYAWREHTLDHKQAHE